MLVARWGAAGSRESTCALDVTAEAIADFKKALETTPDSPSMLNNLAWVLATSPDDKLRDGKESIRLAEKAVKLTKEKAAYILSTYASGFAETGDWDSAVKWSEKAIDQNRKEVEAAKDKDEKKRLEEQGKHLKDELDSYKKMKPWRERQTQEENADPIQQGRRGVET